MGIVSFFTYAKISTMWQFWIDRGGTFTDIVARKPDGSLITHKLLSENPDHNHDAVIQGIRDLMALAPDEPIPAQSIESIKMGTTVATNALLERKGAPTLLLITKGFADLLRIGYQNRPQLFNLKIVLPQLLYCDVAEISERLNAEGQILTPIDIATTTAALKAAYQQGLRSVAIAFMHSYQNPIHEKTVATIAHDIGFTQISLSHQTSRLIKLVGRADTTVVDAYLSPLLRKYVDQVTNALNIKDHSSTRIYFMQSNGGLTDARFFQGRDSILSGPAGGVVGMVAVAKRAGFHQLIGFDMGGTSTDVCHYAGEFERSFETEVAGVRMRAPMMNIHTVAAGGGSILSFKNGRYQVGPESAGADPGPACYRRGGPLTVTDCNVLLGKINPDYFPSVFGPHQNEKLNTDIVREKFNQLATEIAEKTKQKIKTAEETAEGFLKIAIENMANAIKKISVQRGYDITQYTLHCFGGAGGQHACLVAESLGMERIFIHPFAGVLSAFGMGIADIRNMQEEQFERPLADVAAAEKVLERLENNARTHFKKQHIPSDHLQIQKRAYLRFVGSHQTLAVAWGSLEQMRQDFEKSHFEQYSFCPTQRTLIFDMLSVEAIAPMAEITIPHQPPSLKSQQITTCYMGGKKRDIVLLHRHALVPDQSISGPAMIVEETGTSIVEYGWSAKNDSEGNLILERQSALPRHLAMSTQADPVMLEIFNNLFMSIAQQMGATLANTAYSVNIKERLDFSCALFDADGCLVANAPHVPVHLGSMSQSVRTIARLNKGKMQAGDSFMLNAPFNGGTHLPDVTVITPVFDTLEKSILFYVGSRAHHADIGGLTPGSSPPDSTHIEQEGVVIDNFHLVKGGKLQEAETRALLASGAYPCRNIDDNIADIEAQIAANTTGMREVQRMISVFGLEVVQAYMKHVQANAEVCVREVIEKLSDGKFTYTLDNGLKIKVAIKVNLQKREAIIDFTGTSKQSVGNYNAPLSVCRAVVLYVFRTLIGHSIPLNEGCLQPLKIIAPEGSMINPNYPAAVIAGNTEVSQAIADCLFGALNVIAGSQGTMNNFVWGNKDFQNYETICGGTGAGADFHGTSAVHSHMTNTLMTDPEVLEKRFPVMVEEFSIRKQSGGQGQWQGGDGVCRQIKFLQAVTVTVLSGHRTTRAFGGEGGGEGHCGENIVIRKNGTIEKLQGNDACQLHAGDAFKMLTPGGGGWGKL